MRFPATQQCVNGRLIVSTFDISIQEVAVFRGTSRLDPRPWRAHCESTGQKPGIT